MFDITDNIQKRGAVNPLEKLKELINQIQGNTELKKELLEEIAYIEKNCDLFLSPEILFSHELPEIELIELPEIELPEINFTDLYLPIKKVF